MSLSHKGLSRLIEEKDFNLKFGDSDRVIKCSKSQITFISPRIANLIKNDATMNEFTLRTQKSSSCFDIVGNMMNGLPIDVNEDEIFPFRGIIYELQNDELINEAQSDINCDNVFEIVSIKHENGFYYEREVEFIAQF